MASILKTGWFKAANTIPLKLAGRRNVTILASSKTLNYHSSKQYLRRNKNYLQFSLGEFHTSPALAKVIPFNLSDIGEGIREVNVKEWFVKVGDDVKQFDNICEVQSDKASVTITSRYDGKIVKLHHKIDEVAYVGNPLIDIDVLEDDEKLPKTDTKIFSRIGIVGPPEEGEDSDDNESSDSSDDESDSRSIKVLATPAVRRIAMQNNLNLATIAGTGKGRRILKEDILRYLNISSEDSNDVEKMKRMEINRSSAQQPFAKKYPEKPLIDHDSTVPIRGFTKAMVKTMTTSLKIPHFVYSDEVDVTQLVSVRESTKEASARAGVKLTFMPFFIKSASLALKKYPIINSSVDENCENITYKASHNIGVAMDTPSGLVVPNIKEVQNKSIMQIAAELNRLQKDGVKGVFKPDDLMGGTFTISNIGNIGGTYTKPVILAPQVSIGALGKIQVLPRFDKDGNVVKAHIICISWSADHRVIDGVTMARFSNEWKAYVENPSHLMLDL